jgi:8-oxo-dGTP pyrophosphatase MutT (NUDIX family)
MCEVHGRHWGVQGAAGLLPFAVTAGSVAVLLALRSHGTHQGGTWGTIGGAIEPGETPWEAAVREADEEAAGLDLAEDQAAEGHRYGCVSGWAYVTFPVRVPPASPVTIRSNWETSDLRWIPVDEVGSYPLHPALAESWPELRKLVEDRALCRRPSVILHRPDGHEGGHPARSAANGGSNSSFSTIFGLNEEYQPPPTEPPGVG